MTRVSLAMMALATGTVVVEMAMVGATVVIDDDGMQDRRRAMSDNHGVHAERACGRILNGQLYSPLPVTPVVMRH